MFNAGQYNESAAYLRSRLDGRVPEILLITGSGLGDITEQLEDTVHIPYREIPHFKTSTVKGHRGRFAFGKWANKNVLVMDGRLHIYEGYSSTEAAYPVLTAYMLGAAAMVTTSACGGVKKRYRPGDLAVLTDYINLSCPSPLTDVEFGDGKRFCDMTHVFDRDYIDVAEAAAVEAGIALHKGVYFFMPGPQFETPAEIRAIRVLGGDLVGMSTIPECIMARRLGMRVLGVSLVTNMAAGVTPNPLTEGEVFMEAANAVGKLSALLCGFIKKI